jgi:putative lipoic acid-binding regulatory protein
MIFRRIIYLNLLFLQTAKLTEIYKVFDGIKFTLGNRESKNGKYTACNINAFVLDANQVVNIYKEVAKIEGVILL